MKGIKMENISGNISHAYYFISLRWESKKSFTDSIKARFPSAVVYDRTAQYKDAPHIADLQTAERFLHGGGQTYDAARVFLPDMGCTMLVFIPDSRVLCVSHHYSFKDKTSDELIALRQSGQFKPLSFPSFPSCSFDELSGRLCGELGVEFKPVCKSFLLEITHMSPHYDTADELESAEMPLLYGLLSGDEGYAFVPQSVKLGGLAHTWGSRSYMRLYAYDEAFLFINLLDSRERSRYLMRQDEFGGKIYGGVDDYFKMGSCPLTVNHGILFSVEFVMALKALINGVSAYRNRSRQHTSFYRRIKEAGDYRRRVLSVLQKAEGVEISEIGALGKVIQDSQRISPLVEKVKYMLELLEADLNLMYSERNNILITFLTVLGLLLAFMQVILAVAA
ncbi:MAG: hypothetical protein IIY69_02695 [Clostridia bacterium]|nr:hypothetical protein [Clostridia bacterium]